MTLHYKAVVFDLDGTLVDSYEALLIAVNVALAGHGRAELDVQQLRRYVGEGIEPLLGRCFNGDVPAGAHDLFVQKYDEICCDKSRLLEDVEQTLVALDRWGVVMSVCTNKPTSFSEKILAALGTARFFRAIIGPDLAGARKPEARHVLHALAPTGFAPADALFVGDMPIDVQAARAAGLHAAAIPTGSADLEPLSASEPDYMLERFSDLLEIVRPGDGR